MFSKKKAAYLIGLSSLLMPQIALGQTIGKVNATSLNVRNDAMASSAVIGIVNEREAVKIIDLIEENDLWYQVDMEGEQGYIKGKYLTLTKADGIVTASSLNVRSYPDSQESKVINTLDNGTEVDVIYKVNDYYKIMLNGNAGFVHSSYIDCKYDEYLTKQDISKVGTITQWGSTASTATSVVTKGEQIVSTAKQYLGNPYVYGGTSLTSGTDCSGFTQSIMKKFGINIPRTSRDQSKYGTAITKTGLQKGDLLFFGNSTSTISHCGIYIGNGQMIHASSAKTGIIISSAYSSGGKALQVIRRVI